MEAVEKVNSIPIACNITEAQQLEERQTEITEMLRSVERVEELEDGYAFSFAPTDRIASDLLSFILAERKCCPFFTFELIFEPAEGPIRLRLRGGDGVKAFIRQAFYQDVNAVSGSSPQ